MLCLAVQLPQTKIEISSGVSTVTGNLLLLLPQRQTNAIASSRTSKLPQPASFQKATVVPISEVQDMYDQQLISQKAPPCRETLEFPHTWMTGPACRDNCSGRVPGGVHPNGVKEAAGVCLLQGRPSILDGSNKEESTACRSYSVMSCLNQSAPPGVQYRRPFAAAEGPRTGLCPRFYITHGRFCCL
jgi:hypothetical protein